MKKKFQKKLIKAIKKQNYEKIVRICREAYCGVEMTEELVLRALYRDIQK